jgi:hypothetical protein
MMLDSPRWTSKLLTALAPLLLAVATSDSQTPQTATPSTIQGSLYEIKEKPRAQLLIIRSAVLDASDPAKGAVDAVRAGQQTERRHRYPYAVIAKKLNDYIRKYGSLTDAEDAEHADYVIVFNLMRYRRILNSIYPSGEMYVISYRPPGPARVLWKTEKEMLAEDAVNSLIRALKIVHGQR